MALFKNINFEKLKKGLAKTKGKIVDGISETFSGKAVVDEDVLDEIEEILITSDLGVETAEKIIEDARIRLKEDKERDKESFIKSLKNELVEILNKNANPTDKELQVKAHKPYVILVVGVNGAGKTTTIGKLSNNFRKNGLKVVVGAADTFRAAANEQLDIWAERAGVRIIQSKTGDDPSAIAFDTLQIAKKEQSDIVIIDTAGRLHTKKNLMDELNKINRVLKKVLDYAPNEILLVVDGNTGQNAIVQAQEFSKIANITGLVITKLDGTAKGGILFRISNELNIPVRYIGVGEGIEDLQDFDPEKYVDALFS